MNKLITLIWFWPLLLWGQNTIYVTTTTNGELKASSTNIFKVNSNLLNQAVTPASLGYTPPTNNYDGIATALSFGPETNGAANTLSNLLQAQINGKQSALGFTPLTNSLDAIIDKLGYAPEVYGTANTLSNLLQSAIDSKQAALGFTPLTNSSAAITDKLGYVPETNGVANTLSNLLQVLIDAKQAILGYTPLTNSFTAITNKLGYLPETNGAAIAASNSLQANIDLKQAVLGFTPLTNSLQAILDKLGYTPETNGIANTISNILRVLIDLKQYGSSNLTNWSNLTTNSVQSTNVSLFLLSTNNAFALTNLSAAGIASGGTLPALNGAALTSLTAANITAGGTLPALNGSALTDIPSASITGQRPSWLISWSFVNGFTWSTTARYVGVAGGNSSSTESVCASVISTRQLTATNLVVTWGNLGLGNGTNCTVTLMTNGVATGLTLTVLGKGTITNKSSGATSAIIPANAACSLKFLGDNAAVYGTAQNWFMELIP